MPPSKSGTRGGSRVEGPAPRAYVWPHLDRFARGFGKRPKPKKQPPRRREPQPALPWAWGHTREFAKGVGKRPADRDREHATTWLRGRVEALRVWLVRHAWWMAPLLTLVAAILIIVGTFVRYDDEAPREALSEQFDGYTAYYLTLGIGLLLFGVQLAIRRGRSVLVGSVALVALALLTLVEFVQELVYALQVPSYDPGPGFYLQVTGFFLVIVGAKVATLTWLPPLFARSEWSARDRSRIFLLAGGLGFAAAVGFVMNTIGDRFDSFGSPFDPFYPYDLSALIVAMITLAVLPMLAVTTRHWAVAVGLTLAYAFFAIATNFGNLFAAYDSGGSKAVEGTWTFLAASIATGLVLVYSIALPRGPVPALAPRRAASPRPVMWAGRLALVAALFELASLFPRYNDPRFNNATDGATSMHVLVFVTGLAIAGYLLMQREQAFTGAVMLAAIVLLFIERPVMELFGLAEEFDPGVGMGYVLDKIAWGAAVAGALLALWHLRRTVRPRTVPELSGATLLAIFMGVMTAIAIGMNFNRFEFGANGSPFLNPYVPAFGPSSRIVWSSVLVMVALPILGFIAMTAQRSTALGLFYALATFVLATSLYRLSVAYFNGGRHDAEGTWLFVSAGPALVLVVGYHLFVRHREVALPRR